MLNYPLTPLQLELIHRVISKTRSDKFWEGLYQFYKVNPVEKSEFLFEIGTKLLTPELNLKFIPAHPLEFLVGKEYLNKGEDLYPNLIPYFVEMNCGDYVEVVLTGSIGSAKALDVDTPMPTPIGWVRMGDLKDGDKVYSDTGDICSIVKAHPILLEKPCYRINFDDGASLVACEDHLWTVQSASDRTNWKKLSETHRTLSTKQLLNKMYTHNGQPNWSIDLAGPVEGTDINLGIDPYVLGYWLGDGTKNNSSVSVGDEDVASFVHQASRYYHVEVKQYKDRAAAKVVVYGLIYALRALGVAPHKAIPEKVFRASRSQRLAVLQGLLDSDGTVNKNRGSVSFCQVQEELARSVYELVQSLGFKATLRPSNGKYNGNSFVYWRVVFTPSKGDQVFRLERKQKYVGIRDTGYRIRTSRRRYIISIDAVDSRPVRCITVDSPSRLYLAGKNYIPTHNTTLALWSTAYQLYCLSAYINPHKEFEQDPASEILFVFQSINQQLAKDVNFSRFRATVETSAYFKDNFPFDPTLLSQLQFPNRITVKPISGESTGAIGQSIFGGMIDELNFMELVEKSKKTHNESEYNQAIALYDSLSRRRKSRFMKFGRVPGLFCLVSSKRYPGQFTDLKEEEARKEIRETGKSTIYVYDKRTWDVLPASRFSGRWFKLFIGDINRKPRILEDGEPIRVDDTDLIIDVPLEYKSEFERDPMGSLRDIAGVSTLALFPFFQSREDVAEMFGHHPSILSLEETDFVSPPLMILPKKFWRPQLPRWVHIDLSKTKDSTGMTCGCVPGFGAISRGDGVEDFELMPQFHIDFQLRVKPPKGGEILYYKIRSLIYALRDQGLNIKWISCDSYQSTDMLQILRQNNFITGEVSMDKTTLPYETLKSACYDGRVMAPSHPQCELELVGLEMDPKLKFIDHQPGKSKDVADSLAGTVYGLTMRRETWNSHNIPVVKLPAEVQNMMERERERMKELGQYDQMVKQKFEVETEE